MYTTCISILSKLGMKSKVSMKAVEKESVLNLPMYCDNHKELNIRVIRSKVPPNGYILLHLNFVKTGDEIKSQHENSTRGEKKGPHPTDLLINKICCHRSFTTTFGLALPLPTLLACCSSSTLHQLFRIGICELIPLFQ